MLGGCRPSEAKSDVDESPQDEMWLGREQIRRANIQVSTVADADMPWCR